MKKFMVTMVLAMVCVLGASSCSGGDELEARQAILDELSALTKTYEELHLQVIEGMEGEISQDYVFETVGDFATFLAEQYEPEVDAVFAAERLSSEVKSEMDELTKMVTLELQVNILGETREGFADLKYIYDFAEDVPFFVDAPELFSYMSGTEAIAWEHGSFSYTLGQTDTPKDTLDLQVQGAVILKTTVAELPIQVALPYTWVISCNA